MYRMHWLVEALLHYEKDGKSAQFRLSDIRQGHRVVKAEPLTEIEMQIKKIVS